MGTKANINQFEYFSTWKEFGLDWHSVLCGKNQRRFFLLKNKIIYLLKSHFTWVLIRETINQVTHAIITNKPIKQKHRSKIITNQ